MRAARAAAVAVLLCALGATPASASAPRNVLATSVLGARTARITLRAPTLLWPGVSDGGGTAGFLLSRKGDQGFLVDARSADLGGGEFAIDNGGVSDPERSGAAWYLRPGTYDLTVFATVRRTVRVAFSRPVSASFRPVPFATAAARSVDPSPVWRTTSDLALPQAGRGFVVLARDEWSGAGRAMTEACVWQDTPCAAVDAEQLADGTSDAGTHWSLYASTIAGAAPAGTHHVTYQSVVGGTAVRRAAVAFAVP